MDLGLVLLVTATVIGLYMAWTIGANDVANAMGTSVGSGALTLRRAIVVAAIFEFSGSLLVGGTVTDTIRQKIVDVDAVLAQHAPADPAPVTTVAAPAPTDSPAASASSPATPVASPAAATPVTGGPNRAGRVLALGMTCCLLAAAVWLHIATYFGWPVSTTHSIVGAVVGFGIVCGGVGAVHWGQVGQIVLSWLVSPLLGAIIAYLCFRILIRTVLTRDDPLAAVRTWGPIFICPIFLILALSLMYKGLKPLKLDLPFDRALMIACGVGVLASLISFPLLGRMARHDAPMPTGEGLRRTERVFLVLQVMTACYVAFAHGSNDVANAVGPLAAVVGALHDGPQAKVPVPMWVLLIGAVGIVLGLATYGYKVMGTVGEKITELTPSRGFTAEFSAATTIVIASKMGLPISTTHTLVGAVIGVALARGLNALNTQVLKGILASWFITVPFTAVLTMLTYWPAAALFLE